MTLAGWPDELPGAIWTLTGALVGLIAVLALEEVARRFLDVRAANAETDRVRAELEHAKQLERVRAEQIAGLEKTVNTQEVSISVMTEVYVEALGGQPLLPLAAIEARKNDQRVARGLN